MATVGQWLGPWIAMSVACGELGAQSAQPFSLQASGLFNGVFGNVFAGLQDGLGAEAQFRYTPGALSIGAGFQFTVHDVTGRMESVRFYGGFIEPRHRIHVGSNVMAPYASARVSLLKIDFSGGDVSLSSTFLQLNGGGGLLLRLASHVNLDAGATFGYNHLGRGTVTSESSGASVQVASGSGSNVVARLGLAIGLRD